eukprot:4186317-Prymnesium_polylepis.2
MSGSRCAATRSFVHRSERASPARKTSIVCHTGAENKQAGFHPRAAGLLKSDAHLFPELVLAFKRGALAALAATRSRPRSPLFARLVGGSRFCGRRRAPLSDGTGEHGFDHARGGGGEHLFPRRAKTVGDGASRYPRVHSPSRLHRGAQRCGEHPWRPDPKARCRPPGAPATQSPRPP